VSDPVRIRVRVTTRAGVDRIDRPGDGILHLRVTAAPADGAANLAVVRLLAAALDIPKGRVRIATGATSRRKVIAIDGVSRATVASLWPGLDDRLAPRAAAEIPSGDPEARASERPRGAPRAPRG
jgi:uncharacterized protein YggU (UPF0235/DUF167 family)